MLSVLSPTNSCFDINSLYHKKRRSEPFDFRQCLMENRIHKLQSFNYNTTPRRMIHSNNQSELVLPSISQKEKKTIKFSHIKRESPNKDTIKKLNVLQLIFDEEKTFNEYSSTRDQLFAPTTNNIMNSLLFTIEQNKPEIITKINEAITLDALYDTYVKESIREKCSSVERDLKYNKNKYCIENKNQKMNNNSIRKKILHIKHIKFDEILENVISHCLEIRNAKNKVLSIDYITNIFNEEIKRIKEQPIEQLESINNSQRFQILNKKQLNMHSKKGEERNNNKIVLNNRQLKTMNVFYIGNNFNKHKGQIEAKNRMKNYINYHDFNEALRDINAQVSKKTNMRLELIEAIKEAIKYKLKCSYTPNKNNQMTKIINTIHFDNKSINISKSNKPIPNLIIQQLKSEIIFSPTEIKHKRSKSLFVYKSRTQRSRNMKYIIKECKEINLSGKIDSDKIIFSFDKSSIDNFLWYTFPKLGQSRRQFSNRNNDNDNEEKSIVPQSAQSNKKDNKIAKNRQNREILINENNDKEANFEEKANDQIIFDNDYIKINSIKESNEATLEIETEEQTSRLLEQKKHIIEQNTKGYLNIDIEIEDERKEDIIVQEEEIEYGITDDQEKKKTESTIKEEEVIINQPENEKEQQETQGKDQTNLNLSKKKVKKRKKKDQKFKANKQTKTKLKKKTNNIKNDIKDLENTQIKDKDKNNPINKNEINNPLIISNIILNEAIAKRQKERYKMINNLFQASQLFLDDNKRYSDSYLDPYFFHKKQLRRKRCHTICFRSRKKIVILRHMNKTSRSISLPPFEKEQINFYNEGEKSKYNKRKINISNYKLNSQQKSRLSTKLIIPKPFSCDPDIIMTRFFQSNYEQQGSTQIAVDEIIKSESITNQSNESKDLIPIEMPNVNNVKIQKTKEEIELYQKLLEYENRNKEPSYFKIEVNPKSSERIVYQPKYSIKNKFKPIPRNRILDINILNEEKINPNIIKRNKNDNNKENKEYKQESEATKLLDEFRKLSQLTSEDYTKQLTEFLDQQLFKSDQGIKRKLEERMNGFKDCLVNKIKRKEQYRKTVGAKVLFCDTATVSLLKMILILYLVLCI